MLLTDPARIGSPTRRRFRCQGATEPEPEPEPKPESKPESAGADAAKARSNLMYCHARFQEAHMAWANFLPLASLARTRA
eukprot:COSAG04_NODE_9110_length_897_cov_0.944862_2_plen_80_part_00